MMGRIRGVWLAGFAIAGLWASLPQPARGQELLVGVRFGGSFTTFGGDAAEGLGSYRSGPSFGGIVERPIYDWLALRAEPGWIRKGAHGTLSGFEEPIAVNLRLDYAQIPILLQASVPTRFPVRPIVSLGAAWSYEVSCHVGTDPEELALSAPCEHAQTGQDRSSTDWGLLLGMGLESDQGPLVMTLDGRYDVGLVDVGQVTGLKNRGFTVTVGVLVPLG